MEDRQTWNTFWHDFLVQEKEWLAFTAQAFFEVQEIKDKN